MAYADRAFYTDCYHGERIDDAGMDRWLERASDELDYFTCGRLMTAFPKVEAHAIKVKKAVCAIADALCQVDAQRRAAAPQTAADGSACGAIASITSGKESISYSGVNAGGSVYSDAAASQDKLFALVQSIAVQYLAGIPDANGINLLYRGVERCMTRP